MHFPRTKRCTIGNPRGVSIWAAADEDQLLDSLNLISDSAYHTANIFSIGKNKKISAQQLIDLFPGPKVTFDIPILENKLKKAIDNECYEVADLFFKKINKLKKTIKL